MSRKILGLDIQKDSVSAVLLVNSMKGSTVTFYAHASHPGPAEAHSGIVSCLENITHENDLSDAVCIASLPADFFSYRNLSVPFHESKKISQILPYEIEPTLPYPIDDLIIDFKTYTLPSSNENTALLAGAVQQPLLGSYIEALAAFKISPKIITASGFATACCIAGLKDIPSDCVFVAVGYDSCTVYIISAGQIRYLRSAPFMPEDPQRLRAVSGQVKRTITAFGDQHVQETMPEHIVLSGHGITSAGAAAEMSRLVGLPVEPANLAKRMDVPFNDDIKQAWEPIRFDNALALALTETKGFNVLNFRRGLFARKAHWVEHKKELLLSGILAGIIFVLIFFNISLDTYSMAKKVAALDTNIINIFKTTFPETKNIVAPLQQMKSKIDDAQKKLIFPDQSETNVRNIDILNDISRLVPLNLDVEFSRIVIGPGSVLISGDTDTFNSVNEVKRQLEKGANFKAVTINSANTEKSGKRVVFKLKIDT